MTNYYTHTFKDVKEVFLVFYKQNIIDCTWENYLTARSLDILDGVFPSQGHFHVEIVVPESERIWWAYGITGGDVQCQKIKREGKMFHKKYQFDIVRLKMCTDNYVKLKEKLDQLYNDDRISYYNDVGYRMALGKCYPKSSRQVTCVEFVSIALKAGELLGLDWDTEDKSAETLFKHFNENGGKSVLYCNLPFVDKIRTTDIEE
jgi:hypothetical protein